MGASASMLRELPLQLRDEDIQKLTGTDLDKLKAAFNTFKKDDGTVDTQDFLQLFQNEEEREVYHLYEYYCTKDGLLSQSNYLQLCRDAKLLHKLQFPSSEAITHFQNHSKETNSINYFTFRMLLLPEIAGRLGLSIEDMLLRLAHVEVDIDFDQVGSNVTHSTPPAQAETSAHRSALSKSGSLMKAVLRLQSFQRRVHAAHQVSELQEVWRGWGWGEERIYYTKYDLRCC